MYIDPLYIIIMLPTLFIAFIAQILLKYWTNKYFNIISSTQLTGRDALAKISTSYDLNISYDTTYQTLNDHYDPRTKSITLSQKVANTPTIASIAITAHELGHALQDKEKSLLFNFRQLIVPIVNIGSNLGYILIVIGFIISSFNLANIGLIFFSTSTIFAFLTLPIEIDASKKGLKMIKKLNLLNSYEISGAQKVLFGAALTYVAGLISSLSNLLYFFIQTQSLKKRD